MSIFISCHNDQSAPPLDRSSLFPIENTLWQTASVLVVFAHTKRDYRTAEQYQVALSAYTDIAMIHIVTYR
jgi:hypothetical protein